MARGIIANSPAAEKALVEKERITIPPKTRFNPTELRELIDRRANEGGK